ncbi:hypothetical protein GCM10027418_06740 [Mariniluteicoccus endophyticus]
MSLTVDLAHRRRLLERITVGLVIAHLGMAVLHVVGRAVPAVPPLDAPLQIVGFVRHAGLVHWAWWHLVAAAAIVAARSIRSSRACSIASSLSAMVWIAWGVLITAWAWWSVPPTSLVAPLLIAVLAVPTALTVSGAWIDRED